jgi:hypothetical protein
MILILSSVGVRFYFNARGRWDYLQMTGGGHCDKNYVPNQLHGYQVLALNDHNLYCCIPEGRRSDC